MPSNALPPEVQVQLLAMRAPASGGVPKLPPASSPQYAEMVRRGWLPPPKPGSMEYLDFAQANPDLIKMAGSKKGMPSRGIMPNQAESNVGSYNPFAVLSDLLGKQQ